MPTVGNSVKFKFGSQQEFDAIVNKDGDTLYFTTDTLILYQGNQRYSKRTKYGTSSPDGSVEGVEGDLYIQVGGDVATGVPFWYYNGTSWAELFHAQPNLEFTPPKTVNGVGDGGDVKTKVVVSISESKVSSHSHVQILDYFNAGNEVIALYGGMYYPLSSVNSQSGASFERSTVKNGQIVHRSIRIQGTAATIDETENPVDDALSDTSTNPVQNKVIVNKLKSIIIDAEISSGAFIVEGSWTIQAIYNFYNDMSLGYKFIYMIINNRDKNNELIYLPINFIAPFAAKPIVYFSAQKDDNTIIVVKGEATSVTSTVTWTYEEKMILPVCSTSDNGKFLRVVNGVPTWVALTNVAEEGA